MDSNQCLVLHIFVVRLLRTTKHNTTILQNVTHSHGFSQILLNNISNRKLAQNSEHGMSIPYMA